MARSRTSYTLINSSVAILSRFVSMGLGFVQRTIFIRTLGASYTGVSGLFTDILTVLSLAELGIGSAIAYSLYKPIAENDSRKIAALMNFFKKAYTLIAGVVFVCGLCLLPFLDKIVTDVPDITESIQLIFILYVANSAVTYLLVYKNTLLVAAQKQYIVSNVQMLFAIVSIAVQCVTLILFKDFVLYLVLQILFSLAQNLTINIIATKQYPELKDYRSETISEAERKHLFRDVGALMLYKISNVVTTGTDSTIISASLGTTQVGILGNYRTIRGYVSSIIAQFYNSINPSLGNLAVTEGNERQYSFFKKLNFGTFWLSCFCSTCFFNLFNPFVKIWLGDSRWLLSTAVVGVYVSEFFFSTMIGPVGAVRSANGLFVQTKYLALIKALLNLGISIALVKPLGILGVLLGTIISFAVTQLWYEPLVIYKHVFKKNVFSYYLSITCYFAISVLCCGAVTLVMQFVRMDNLVIELLIRFALCMVIPNAVVVILYGRTAEFRECIGLVKKILSKFVHKSHKNQEQ